jgi:myosin heavy subunit
VLVVAICGLVLVGCSSDKPTEDNRRIEQAVSKAQRLLDQAQAQMSLPVIVHEASGAYAPLEGSQIRARIEAMEPLKRAATPRGDQAAAPEAVQKYQQALAELPIGVLPGGDVHPSLLSDKAETNVLVQAESLLETAMAEATQADDEARTLALMTLARVRAARARAFSVHALALGQDGLRNRLIIERQLGQLDTMLSKADQHQTRVDSISGQSKMGQSLEKRKALIGDLSQQVEQLEKTVEQSQAEAERKTEQYVSLRNEYDEKLAQAKAGSGQAALDLLEEAVDVAKRANVVAREARQAQTKAEKSAGELALKRSELEQAREEAGQIEQALKNQNSEIEQYRKLRSQLVERLRGPEGLESELAGRIEKFSARVKEISEAQVEAENIIASARATYASKIGRAREAEPHAVAGQMAMMQSNLMMTQLALAESYSALAKRIRTQWARTDSAAVSGVEVLENYLPEPVKVRSQAAELAGEAGGAYDRAASFADRDVQWLYRQNAGIAYVSQFRLGGSQEARNNAVAALDQALQGNQESSPVVENDRSIRALLQG